MLQLSRKIVACIEYCLCAITVLLCLSLQQAMAQGQVSWEALSEHVADRLIPPEELPVTECPANLDYKQVTSRSVLQWIENTFYSWTEYQVTPGDDGLFCIVMEQPHSGALSEEEAGVLLSASRLWVEAKATSASDDMEILDPDDPQLNMPAFEKFLQEETEEALDEASSLEDEQDSAPDTGIGPEDDLEPWDEGVSSLPHPAEDLASEGENRVPQAVFNPDGRERVTATRSYPWSTIAFVAARFPNGERSRGTAFLVSPYTALTNGHVVYHPTDGGWASSVQIAPGQRQYREGGSVERPFGTRDSSSLRISGEYRSRVDANPSDSYPESTYAYDYGAILFSQRFNGISTFMPLVFDKDASRVNVAGYPSAVQGETNSRAQWHGFGPTVRSDNSRTIGYRISSSKGASGGPVWLYYQATNTQRVIAINAFSGENYNGGPRLVSQNRKNITEWMRWTPSRSGRNGHDDYCREHGPCSAGQGDCERGECRSGLECVQDVGAQYGFKSYTDVCEPSNNKLPIGHNDYCREHGPCSAGQGDCERGECRSGLECVQDVGAQYGFKSYTDVCEPSNNKLPIGHNDYCREHGPCSAGQGDCERGECRSGLECVQDVGAQYGFKSYTDVCEVPGRGGWNAVYWTAEPNGCHWVGWSLNNRTRQQAESNAQANCQRGQCPTTCRLASAWSGNACFGYVRSRKSSGSYTIYLDFGHTASEAESATLRRCRNAGRTNCELRVSRCP